MEERKFLEKKPRSDNQEAWTKDHEPKKEKKARLMPRKGDYRMRAHINPLNDTPWP